MTCCCCVCLQILMTGEVAGLFPKEELDVIVNDMRPIMKAEAPGKPPPLCFLAQHSTLLLCPLSLLLCTLFLDSCNSMVAVLQPF